MVLYKRRVRFCLRISTLLLGSIQEIRGRWQWEAPSVCVVALYVTFKFSLYNASFLIWEKGIELLGRMGSYSERL